jgi:hypothetical protein
LSDIHRSSTHQSPPLSTPAKSRRPTNQTPSHSQYSHDEPQPTPQPLQAYSVMPSGFGYPGLPVPPKSGPGSIAGIVYASVYSGVSLIVRTLWTLADLAGARVRSYDSWHIGHEADERFVCILIWTSS